MNDEDFADVFEMMLNNSDSNETLANKTLNDTLFRQIWENHRRDSALGESGIAIGLLVLYIPTFLAGVIGNGLLAVVILTRRRLRNVTNLFLVNLAFADLAVTIVCIPLAVGQALYKLWIYGEFMCKITGFLQGVTVAASVFTIMLLSLDRYIAIRHPMIFRRHSTNRVAIRLILIVWVISIGLMTPLLIVRKITVLDLVPADPIHFCGEHWPVDSQRQHYDIGLFVIIYVIPGTIICFSYGLIGGELWKEDINLNRTESATSKELGDRMMKGRKRVAKMLIAVAVLFAICWLPYYCVSLYLDFQPSDTRLLMVLPYTIFMGHSNSAFNPILYFYSSKSFRCLLKRMLRCKKQRFKPERRENMIVRCTRNKATTTTALTRRPFIRIISNSSLVSRSGSLRFSRSSNTSLKSSSGTNRTSLRSTTSSPLHRSPRKSEKVKNVEHYQRAINCPEIAIIEASYVERENFENNDKSYHKKAFMEATISIPTTINEESSRHNSIVPPVPAIEAIYEEQPSQNIENTNDQTQSPSTENMHEEEQSPSTENMNVETETPSPTIEIMQEETFESFVDSSDKDKNVIEMKRFILGYTLMPPVQSYNEGLMKQTIHKL